jgi:polyisoprenoid-binding protein YceI
MKKNTRFKDAVSQYARCVLGPAVIFLAGLPGITRAQNTYKAADPDIKVLGTSNLHNWSMEAKDISCSAKFDFLPGNSSQLQSLTALDLSIPVHNLKSGESLMDSRAYDALKADKFAAITYVLTSATIVPGQKNQFQVRSTGNMTIAGATRPVALNVGCLVNPDGTITCNGSEQLKMTDYKIKPPVFMLGALRTGDALTVNFSLTLKNK